MLFAWIGVFIISLAVLVRAADYFTKGAEITGLKLKINPFIIGVTIVSIGTSLPELVTSLVATANDQTTIVVANAVGSNIANILLVIGLASVFATSLAVKRSLIDLDAPLLSISTVILLAILWDKQVTTIEAVLLLLTYLVYIAYTVKTGQKKDGVHDDDAIDQAVKKKKAKFPTMSWGRIVLYLIFGAVGVYFGADWVIKSVIEIASRLGIDSSVIAITAIAFGTSLPELVVSISAARKGSYEIALGNVFGSNIFNSLMVIGIPALFTTIPVDPGTFSVGLFFMATATLLYVFSGISKTIHKWEGFMYLILYILFVIKIFSGAL